MADGQEIERKWLVEDELPADVIALEGEQIDQGYLTIGDDGDETRLRRRAGAHVLTTKSGRGLVRSETSIELTPEQFEKLWPVTVAARVEKVRRVFPVPGSNGELEIELDIYSGGLTGLVVAEVEFPDADAARAFTAPDWFGADVTDDDRYKNHALAKRGKPD